ncbi:MAG: hypothetical protein WBA57_21585 [Elainellaceae cyanobacterium]
MADQRRFPRRSQHSSSRPPKKRGNAPQQASQSQQRSHSSKHQPQVDQGTFFSPKYPQQEGAAETYSHTASARVASKESGSPSPQILEQHPNSDAPPRRKKGGIFKSWIFWTTLAIALLGGVSGFSFALLYKIPALPNCPSIFWPTASASLRMYCAELAANKKTVDDLLTAIDLVDGLPSDHPMRQEADVLIDGWSLQILDLAEVQFQKGELELAIEMAEKIPVQGAAHDQVGDRIDQWRSVWAKAEEIYAEAESAIQSDNLQKAFSVAVELLSVGNEYWATVKYEQINTLIETSREISAKLAEARSLSRQGGLSNLLAAIEKVETIEEDSFLYPAARRLLVELWDDVLEEGKAALDRGEVDGVGKIADRLPPGLEYQAQANDLRELALAVQRAQSGTVSGLEAAIVLADGLPGSRPLYSKAQELSRSWQLEVQDLRRLERAKAMAAPGTVSALQDAIAEVKLVPNSNPRSAEAQQLANEWLNRIYTIEDRPVLERAEQLASQGDVFSLQAAILEARRIGDNRPLHDEARRQIRNWTSQVERIQDRPYLSEANQIAQSGNLQQAINVAGQIRPGRALYEEAQTNIRNWQRQINQTAQSQQGRARLQQATGTANAGTPEALAAAIRVANQIERDNPQRSEADRLVNQWSEALLRIAQNEASRNLQRAIAVAEMVPPQTTAFAPAQLQIREWRSRLAPRESEPVTNPESQL